MRSGVLQTSNGYDVFISYSHKEEALAREFEAKLAEQILRCFLTPLTIQASSAWEREMWQAARSARVFLFLVSTEALKSKWCRAEIGAAIALQRPIIPALVHSIKLPDILKQFQSAQAQTDSERDGLVQHIKGLCST